MNNMELRKLLIHLGISSNLQGYHSIIAAEKILEKQQIHINMISLYQMLGKKFDKNPSAIERSIRHAILKSYKTKDVLKNIYGAIPDNSEFLYDLYFNFDLMKSETKRG